MPVCYYNALSSGAFQSAAVIAPPIGGWLIGAGAHGTYIAMLVLGSLAMGAYAVTAVERALPPGTNGGRVPEGTTASSPDRSG